MYEKLWFFCSNFPSTSAKFSEYLVFLFWCNEIEIPKFRSLAILGQNCSIFNYHRSLFSSFNHQLHRSNVNYLRIFKLSPNHTIQNLDPRFETFESSFLEKRFSPL